MNISPKDASNVLNRHFSEVSERDFVDRVERHCPKLSEATDMLPLADGADDEPSRIMLFRSRPSPLPLNAYLASALTGLTPDQRTPSSVSQT